MESSAILFANTTASNDLSLESAAVPLVLHNVKTADQAEAHQEAHDTAHQAHGAVLLGLEVGRKHEHDGQGSRAAEVEEADHEALDDELGPGLGVEEVDLAGAGVGVVPARGDRDGERAQISCVAAKESGENDGDLHLGRSDDVVDQPRNSACVDTEGHHDPQRLPLDKLQNHREGVDHGLYQGGQDREHDQKDDVGHNLAALDLDGHIGTVVQETGQRLRIRVSGNLVSVSGADLVLSPGLLCTLVRSKMEQQGHRVHVIVLEHLLRVLIVESQKEDILLLLATLSTRGI